MGAIAGNGGLLKEIYKEKYDDEVSSAYVGEGQGEKEMDDAHNKVLDSSQMDNTT